MSQFYCKVFPNGDKSYYDSKTGAAVRKRSIPVELHDYIPEFNSNKHVTSSNNYEKNRKRLHGEVDDIMNSIRKIISELEMCDDDDSIALPSILLDQNILNSKDWRFWLKRNHSDKNPDVDESLLKSIINAGRDLGW